MKFLQHWYKNIVIVFIVIVILAVYFVFIADKDKTEIRSNYISDGIEHLENVNAVSHYFVNDSFYGRHFDLNVVMEHDASDDDVLRVMNFIDMEKKDDFDFFSQKIRLSFMNNASLSLVIEGTAITGNLVNNEKLLGMLSLRHINVYSTVVEVINSYHTGSVIAFVEGSAITFSNVFKGFVNSDAGLNYAIFDNDVLKVKSYLSVDNFPILLQDVLSKSGAYFAIFKDNRIVEIL